MTVTNGLATTLPPDSVWSGIDGEGVTATPTGLPIIAIGMWTLGAIKTFIARYGWTVLKMLVSSAVLATIMKLIMGGASDSTKVKIKKKGKKRMSIGTNPRLGTLLKVSKRCDNLLTKTDNRIRKFRARIHGTGYRRPQVVYAGHDHHRR